MKFIIDKSFLDSRKPTTFVSFMTYRGLENSNLELDRINLLIDGSILVKLSNLFSRKRYFNYHFDLSGFGYLKLREAIDIGVPVVIFGGSESEAQIAQEFLNKCFTTDLIVVKDGFQSLEKFRRDATFYHNHLVVLSVGSPLQEEVALELTERGKFFGIFTSGGFISQTARNKGNYYPRYIRFMNLRFLYRSIKEKGHLKRIFRNLGSFMPMLRDILNS